jgi:hypothetical protein
MPHFSPGRKRAVNGDKYASELRQRVLREL